MASDKGNGDRLGSIVLQTQFHRIGERKARSLKLSETGNRFAELGRRKFVTSSAQRSALRDFLFPCFYQRSPAGERQYPKAACL